jgi:hypothetical protein
MRICVIRRGELFRTLLKIPPWSTKPVNTRKFNQYCEIRRRLNVRSKIGQAENFSQFQFHIFLVYFTIKYINLI